MQYVFLLLKENYKSCCVFFVCCVTNFSISFKRISTDIQPFVVGPF